MFTAPWHSSRHATVSFGGSGRRLCLHCASAYLAAAVSGGGGDDNEHQRQPVAELLDLMLELPPLRPPSAAASTLPALLRSWLLLVLQSSGGSGASGELNGGKPLALRVGLAAAGLVQRQVTALTLRPHPSLLTEFFGACNVSQPSLMQCMSLCLCNPVMARAASQHRGFTRKLLALPRLSTSALSVSFSIMKLSGNANHAFANEFLDSLFEHSKLGRTLLPPSELSEAVLSVILAAFWHVDFTAIDTLRLDHLLRVLVPLFVVDHLQTLVVEICAVGLERGVDPDTFLHSGMLTSIVSCPKIVTTHVAQVTLGLVKKLCLRKAFFEPAIVVITLDLLSNAVKKLVAQRKLETNAAKDRDTSLSTGAFSGDGNDEWRELLKEVFQVRTDRTFLFFRVSSENRIIFLIFHFTPKLTNKLQQPRRRRRRPHTFRTCTMSPSPRARARTHTLTFSFALVDY